METTVINATEYCDLPLSQLNESKTNPRRVFDEASLKELAASIRSQGVLSPLLVRPLTENGFEIVAGARRYRAAQMAETAAVPVRIVHLSDAEVIEAQLVENLIRAEIHPMEEAEGFARLLALEEPKYSIEQISARVGKQPSFVASRLKLIDLVPAAVEAFYANEIGVGHALLLAKLPADQQEQALSACFKEVHNGAGKPARILLPVRNLQFWIESNVLLVLKDAPFDKHNAQLVPTADSCADGPNKRTGHNKLLFGDDFGRQGDQCTDPGCYQAKLTAHVAQTVAAKPGLMQISTALISPVSLASCRSGGCNVRFINLSKPRERNIDATAILIDFNDVHTSQSKFTFAHDALGSAHCLCDIALSPPRFLSQPYQSGQEDLVFGSEIGLSPLHRSAVVQTIKSEYRIVEIHLFEAIFIIYLIYLQ
jgi:ParB/RepB/Spo0J family partition protein